MDATPLTPARRLSTSAWLAWASAALSLGLSTRNPFYLVLLLMALLVILTSFPPASQQGGMRPGGLARLVVFICSFSAIFNGLIAHVGDHPLVALPATIPVVGGAITAEALVYGGVNGLSLVTAMAAFLIISPHLEAHALLKMVPPGLARLGTVLGIALGFVPMTSRSWANIREAQQVRGHRIRSIKDLPPLVLPILTTALERALQLAEGMEIRGFGGARTPQSTLALRLLVLASLVCLVVGMALAYMTSRFSLAGWGLLLAGAAVTTTLLFRSSARPHPTRFPGPPPTRADRATFVTAGITILGAAALLNLPGALLAYTPYPSLDLPFFVPWVGLLICLPMLPALWPRSWFFVRRSSANASLAPAQPVPLPQAEYSQPVAAAPIIQFTHVSYWYPENSIPALEDITLEIPAGSFVLVTGPSGVGKSTFLRAINGLVPLFSGGRFAGEIHVAGVNTLETEPRRLSETVGFVSQSPEAQCLTDTVESEIVFPMENRGWSPGAMAWHLRRALRLMQIESLAQRPTYLLSGGERQRTALAAALSLQPQMLVLDEPTSQLDPAAADGFMEILTGLHRQMHLTIILAEHRTARVLPYITHLLHFPALGAPPLLVPATQAQQALAQSAVPLPHPLLLPAGSPAESGPAVVVEQLHFAYPGQPPILQGMHLTVAQGSWITITGRNGCGKTTLLKHLAGLLPPPIPAAKIAATSPNRGTIQVCGHPLLPRSQTSLAADQMARLVGYVPQDPDSMLFAETAIEELRFTQNNLGVYTRDPLSLLERLGLGPVAQSYPRDLSAGQRQRLALAAILIAAPAILVLDEPSLGLDPQAKWELVRLLQELQTSGATIIVATHDNFLSQAANQVYTLAEGQLTPTPAVTNVSAYAFNKQAERT
ncbi:MAG: ATP-binding cassette domain-containing protein [Chloroflexi bacterium]|nr:ATP-binding cassette domain-containing protein [Chloroflexota bacterium]